MKSTSGKYLNRLHYISGLLIAVFTIFHLANHLFSLKGPATHIEVMEKFRAIYRNPVIETLLMMAVVIQIISGIRLVKRRKGTFHSLLEKTRYYSGLYLAIFLVIHPVAIWVGRLVLDLDTNFYFGALGFNQNPYFLFFFPYYLLAVLSFFSHMAVVHYSGMQKFISKKIAGLHAWIIIGVGLIVFLLIVFGFTNGFKGIPIPVEYHYLPAIPAL